MFPFISYIWYDIYFFYPRNKRKNKTENLRQSQENEYLLIFCFILPIYHKQDDINDSCVILILSHFIADCQYFFLFREIAFLSVLCSNLNCLVSLAEFYLDIMNIQYLRFKGLLVINVCRWSSDKLCMDLFDTLGIFAVFSGCWFLEHTTLHSFLLEFFSVPIITRCSISIISIHRCN